MKKIAVIFLSMLYLNFALGYIQHIHLCKGVASIAYSLTYTKNQNQDKPCPMCSDKDKTQTEKKKNCCQHETKLVKLNDSVWQQLNFDFSVKFLADAIPNKMLGTVFDFSGIEPNTKQSTHYSSSNVLVQDNSLYILYCVYRI